MASSPAANTPAPELSRSAPLWAWASASIRYRAHAMLSHVEGVRAGEDIEAVHDMRVGSRRLVAALRVFERAFPDPSFARLLREAKGVQKRLGDLRDLDVLVHHYQRLRGELSPGRMKGLDGLDAGGERRDAGGGKEEQPALDSSGTDSDGGVLGVDYLLAILERRRMRARKPALAVLQRAEESDFSGRLQRYLETETEAYSVGMVPLSRGSRMAGSSRRPQPAVTGETPFGEAACLTVLPRLATLAGFRPWVDHPEATTQLHEMRIAAKWLRYTMELFAPAFPDELEAEIRSVKRIQELLGDLHDSDVRLDEIRRALAEPLDFRGLEALGLMLPDPVIQSLHGLCTREERQRAAGYRAFRRAWGRLEKARFLEECERRFHTERAPSVPNAG